MEVTLEPFMNQILLTPVESLYNHVEIAILVEVARAAYFYRSVVGVDFRTASE